MAIRDHHPLREQIRQHNHCLDCELKRRAGISVQVYKVVKALTQLAGAGAVVYGMTLGADPGFAILLLTIIISGPEALEFVLTNQQE